MSRTLESDAYFEARSAFVDCPDVRIHTDDGAHPQAVVVRGEQAVDGEVLAFAYSVLREHHDDRHMLGAMAQRARGQWGRELERREPSEPLNLHRLREHIAAYGGHSFYARGCEIRVNDTWGADMRMRLAPSLVVLSPAAYALVRKECWR